jgi:hypothetical protein
VLATAPRCARGTVALGKPVALDAGQTFAIREGGRTDGHRPARLSQRVRDSRVSYPPSSIAETPQLKIVKFYSDA